MESLEHTLGRIDERTAKLAGDFEQFTKDTAAHLSAQDNKIQSLHNWKAQVLGASGVFVLFATLYVTYMAGRH